MEIFHGTTILSVRRDGAVALGGDGQVTLGNVVIKATAKKIRRLYHDKVLAGFAGATADAFTLFERFEAKLEKHQGHLTRSAVELAKDWRSDRVLRRLEAMLAVADRSASLLITGTGDVLEPEFGIVAIGSGGPYAQAATFPPGRTTSGRRGSHRQSCPPPPVAQYAIARCEAPALRRSMRVRARPNHKQKNRASRQRRLRHASIRSRRCVHTGALARRLLRARTQRYPD